MKKYFITSMLIICLFCFSGCYKKIDPKIITGVEKMYIASEKISKHNLEHCEEEYAYLLKSMQEATTEEEREEYKLLAEEELQWIDANKKLPIAIKTLLDTLKE